jgi:D-alanyl-D-alanine carboxypeptidase
MTFAQLVAEAKVRAGKSQNPGMQVYLRTGDSEESLAAGVADPKRRPLTTEDTLMIASVSKPMVAAATMALVDAGKLSLDDPVQKLLPGVLPKAKGVTVAHLLSLSSGMADYGSSPRWKGPGTTSHLGLLALIKDAPLEFTPGSESNGANTNYAALGAIIEKVTGKPLGAVLRDTVFRPAGMGHSSLGGNPSARGMAGDQDVTPATPKYPSAAAGVVGTATDLGHFMVALSSGKLVTPASLKAMTDQRVMGQDGGYGLGITRYHTACGEAFGHFGRNDAFSSAAFYLPASGRVVAVTANSGANDDLQALVNWALCA